VSKGDKRISERVNGSYTENHDRIFLQARINNWLSTQKMKVPQDMSLAKKQLQSTFQLSPEEAERSFEIWQKQI